MELFKDANDPHHIQEVNRESRLMFSRLRGDKKTFEEYLGIPYEKIDLAIAWPEFDSLFYQEAFKYIDGDTEMLYDGTIRNRVLSATMEKLSIVYYVRLLTDKGIMEEVQALDGYVYRFKDIYKDSIKTLLTADSTRKPS